MIYIVGSPIGNLYDLSFRQARIITSADIILAEDTRSFRHLLQLASKLFSFPVKKNQQILSYYKDNEFERLPQIIDFLKKNLEVALVSESGMPLISDPGQLLINYLVRHGYKFTVIPGPSSITTAIAYSGFSAKNFYFLGFLPKKKTDKTKLFLELKQSLGKSANTLLIFFDSPYRINETLTIISSIFPKSDVVIARELTKLHEEIIRGKASELVDRRYRGEITVIINQD